MNIEDKKLLISIPHHFNPERIEYLKSILRRFLSYRIDTTILIDTNSHDVVEYLLKHNNMYVYVHTKLKHPHHLTWIHRQHIENFINDFDYFMYIEDDIDLPFENFVEYLNNFALLWPKYIPSFIRIEEKDNTQYVVDQQKAQKIDKSMIVQTNNKKFILLQRPYHAFWIMPQKELKQTMVKDFVKYNICREMAASYPIYELKKIPLVMLDKSDKISPLCYSYHLPNNYVNTIGDEHKFGRVKLEDLIIT